MKKKSKDLKITIKLSSDKSYIDWLIRSIEGSLDNNPSAFPTILGQILDQIKQKGRVKQ
jgi:hypothetical protein